VGEKAGCEGATGLQELAAVGEGGGLLHRRPLRGVKRPASIVLLARLDNCASETANTEIEGFFAQE
jgi:hypothetical protein